MDVAAAVDAVNAARARSDFRSAACLHWVQPVTSGWRERWREQGGRSENLSRRESNGICARSGAEKKVCRYPGKSFSRRGQVCQQVRSLCQRQQLAAVQGRPSKEPGFAQLGGSQTPGSVCCLSFLRERERKKKAKQKKGYGVVQAFGTRSLATATFIR